MIKNFASLIYL